LVVVGESDCEQEGAGMVVSELYGDRYTMAAICRRGHVESINIAGRTMPPRCPECGASILMACASCGARIRGYMKDSVVFGGGFDAPEFCDGCGAPHPWASRQSRFYELENLLEDQDLDAADALKVRDELEALREDPSDDEQVEVRRWKVIQKLAPGLMSAGERIIESVVTATIKTHLGL
jgi:hypothetical protein